MRTAISICGASRASSRFRASATAEFDQMRSGARQPRHRRRSRGIRVELREFTRGGGDARARTHPYRKLSCGAASRARSARARARASAAGRAHARGARVAAARDAIATRWLLKPRRSGGGHGIVRWTRGMAVPRSSIVQERIRGSAGSIIFVADGAHIVPLALTRQLSGDSAFGASGFAYCGSILEPHRPELFANARRARRDHRARVRAARRVQRRFHRARCDSVRDRGESSSHRIDGARRARNGMLDLARACRRLQ